MSERLTKISEGKENSGFVVPDDFFKHQREKVIAASSHEYVYSEDFFVLNAGLLSDSSEFDVPIDYFLRSRNKTIAEVKLAKTKRLILISLLSTAAFWLIGLLLYDQKSSTSQNFSELLAETTILPEDVLINATDDDLYLAFAVLADTIYIDSMKCNHVSEKFDAKTGLPLHKANQLDGLKWEHIDSTDVFEYLDEYVIEDEYFN